MFRGVYIKGQRFETSCCFSMVRNYIVGKSLLDLHDIAREHTGIQASQVLAPREIASFISARVTGLPSLGVIPFNCLIEAVTGTIR